MQARVDQDKCISCGNCCALTDRQIFDFTDEGLAECILKEIPKDLEQDTKDAIEQCPTGAIEEVK